MLGRIFMGFFNMAGVGLPPFTQGDLVRRNALRNCGKRWRNLAGAPDE
jgi:hypothetical protein